MLVVCCVPNFNTLFEERKDFTLLKIKNIAFSKLFSRSNKERSFVTGKDEDEVFSVIIQLASIASDGANPKFNYYVNSKQFNPTHTIIIIVVVVMKLLSQRI